MRWLVTAFEPFGKAKTNSSQIVLDELKKTWQHSDSFRFLGNVPVSFSRSWPLIELELSKHPEVHGLLCLGQAESRVRIGLEMVALNWQDARIADNDGAQPVRLRPHPTQNDMHWTSIPWHKMNVSKALVETSYSAGVYVCNDVFFKTMQWVASGRGRHGGFIHLPLVTNQNDAVFKDMPRIQLEECVKTMSYIFEFLSHQT